MRWILRLETRIYTLKGCDWNLIDIQISIKLQSAYFIAYTPFSNYWRRGTYWIQSMMGHTDTHRVHPVHSSDIRGMWVLESKWMAWYPESLHVI